MSKNKALEQPYFEIGVKLNNENEGYTFRITPDKDGLYWISQEDLKKALDKEWQGLSDNEIDYEFREMEAWQVPMTEKGLELQERRYYTFVKACKIAEQKLKEKNQ